MHELKLELAVPPSQVGNLASCCGTSQAKQPATSWSDYVATLRDAMVMQGLFGTGSREICLGLEKVMQYACSLEADTNKHLKLQSNWCHG